MSDKVDMRITPSLHPLNVTKIDGYDSSTAVHVGATERVFKEAYAGIAAVLDARAASDRDPTLNDAGRVIKIDDMAQKVLGKVNRAFDAERVNLEKGIAHIEQQLTAPVTAKAAHPLASEIRSHCKNLPLGERIGFIRAAIRNGDADTASSVLGAPAYLSGIEADMQAVLLRVYHEHSSPEQAKRLKVMIGAKELIENRGGLLFTQLEKAVGAKPHEVRRMREAKIKSDKAFVIQPAA